jgi:hypothetical protein
MDEKLFDESGKPDEERLQKSTEKNLEKNNQKKPATTPPKKGGGD